MTAAIDELPWVLFPQCGVDGFFSNVHQHVAMVAALSELKGLRLAPLLRPGCALL